MIDMDIEYDKGVVYDDRWIPNPKRVYYDEVISESIERIPFLKRFIEDDWVFTPMNPIPFDRKKMNDYYGYEKIPSGGICTSQSTNDLLEEAEKRGDI